jgi:hypothetical protein
MLLSISVSMLGAAKADLFLRSFLLLRNFDHQIKNGLVVANVNVYYENVFLGVIVLAQIALDSMRTPSSISAPRNFNPSGDALRPSRLTASGCADNAHRDRTLRNKQKKEEINEDPQDYRLSLGIGSGRVVLTRMQETPARSGSLRSTEQATAAPGRKQPRLPQKKSSSLYFPSHIVWRGGKSRRRAVRERLCRFRGSHDEDWNQHDAR